MRAMATLSAQLAESERTVRALEHQLESTVLKKNELNDQLQAINAQVPTEITSMALYSALCPVIHLKWM